MPKIEIPEKKGEELAGLPEEEKLEVAEHAAQPESDWLKTHVPRQENIPKAHEPKARKKPKIALPKINFPKIGGSSKSKQIKEKQPGKKWYENNSITDDPAKAQEPEAVKVEDKPVSSKDVDGAELSTQVENKLEAINEQDDAVLADGQDTEWLDNYIPREALLPKPDKPKGRFPKLRFPKPGLPKAAFPKITLAKTQKGKPIEESSPNPKLNENDLAENEEPPKIEIPEKKDEVLAGLPKEEKSEVAERAAKPEADLLKRHVPGQEDAPKPREPKMSIKPKIALPKINLPRIAMPKIGLPKIGLPKVNLPKFGRTKKEDPKTVKPDEYWITDGLAHRKEPQTIKTDESPLVAKEQNDTLKEEIAKVEDTLISELPITSESGIETVAKNEPKATEAEATQTQQKAGPRKKSLPKVPLPKIGLPKFSIPKPGLPKISLPKPGLPKVSLPKFRRKKKDAAPIEQPEESLPATKAPKVEKDELLQMPESQVKSEEQKVSEPAEDVPKQNEPVKAPVNTPEPEVNVAAFLEPSEELKEVDKIKPRLSRIAAPKIAVPKVGIPKIKLPATSFSIKKIFAVFMLTVTVVIAMTIAFKPKNPIQLPGTQPGEVQSLASPTECFACHEDKTFNNAPATLWRGSMHSNAAVDPLFLAALSVSNEDLKDSGTFCIKCHSPRAFLAGRATPADGSKLDSIDKWGVTCDFCHRLVDPKSELGKELVEPDVNQYENGMFVVSPDTETKRGPYKDSVAPHPTKYSEFHRRSDLCGTCHDVTNPLNGLPLERTYSEWKQSWYAEQGEEGNCQSCHMESKPGYAAGPYYNYGSEYREFLPNHNFSGGSNWIFDVISYFEPNANKRSLQQGKERGLKKLKQAAELEVSSNRYGFKKRLTVRTINKTGHKLPTGFPEGRRAWLNVQAFDKANRLIYESGRYDNDSGELAKDEEIKVYEAKPGITGTGPTFHFALNNYIAKDNRIPPKGFTNSRFNEVGAEIIDYKYNDGQYWDDSIYMVPYETSKVVVTLYYQTTSKEYIEFLRDNDKKSPYGKKLYDVWAKTGKSAPVEMAAKELALD